MAWSRPSQAFCGSSFRSVLSVVKSSIDMFWTNTLYWHSQFLLDAPV